MNRLNYYDTTIKNRSDFRDMTQHNDTEVTLEASVV